jgi:hypothetical protein
MVISSISLFIGWVLFVIAVVDMLDIIQGGWKCQKVLFVVVRIAWIAVCFTGWQILIMMGGFFLFSKVF